MKTKPVVRLIASAILMVAAASAPAAAKPPLSDTAVKQRMIRESIASYPGNCPCPYNSARNGSRCGGRSAYNRAGGYAPLCFPADITKGDVNAYRRANSL